MQKSPQFFNQSEQALRHHSNKYEMIARSLKEEYKVLIFSVLCVL